MYLKPDSVPAQQEMRARRACQLMSERAKRDPSTDRRSYPINSTLYLLDGSGTLPFFRERPFGRG